MKVRHLRKVFYPKKGGPRNLGLRCKVYAPGCIVCDSYKYYDEHGRFPTFDEIFPISQKAGEEDHKAWLQTDEGKAWTDRMEAKKTKGK